MPCCWVNSSGHVEGPIATIFRVKLSRNSLALKMNAPCSPKRRHYFALFKPGIEKWEENEYWLENEVEGCSSSLLWITLQVLSLHRMSKSTKRKAIAQGGRGINSKPAGCDRSQKTTYAIFSERPVSRKPLSSFAMHSPTCVRTATRKTLRTPTFTYVGIRPTTHRPELHSVIYWYRTHVCTVNLTAVYWEIQQSVTVVIPQQ